MAERISGGTIATIILFVVFIGLPLIYFIYRGSKMVTSDMGKSSQSSYSPLNQQGQTGGRKNKKSKSKKMMSTSGIYLLLAAVLIGYITSKFV